jgi:hypothetical protein
MKQILISKHQYLNNLQCPKFESSAAMVLFEDLDIRDFRIV